jgi:hypothetical protein
MMLRTLLRLRTQMWWNTQRRQPGRAISSAIVSVVITTGMFIAVHHLITSLEAIAPGASASFIPGGLAIFIIFPLLHGFSATLRRLFLNSDLDLLMAAPINIVDMFMFQSISLLGLLGIQVASAIGLLVAYVHATAAPLMTLLLGAIALVALFGCAVWTAMIAVMLAARLVPPRRLRGAITVVGALLGGSIYLSMQLLVMPTHRPGLGMLQRLGASSNALRWLPTGWVGQVIAAAQRTRPSEALGPLLMIIGLSGALALVAFSIFRTTFFVSWGRFASVPGGGRKTSRAEPARSVLGAFVRKDLRIMRRDPTLSSSFILPVFFVIATSVRAVSGGDTPLASRLGNLIAVPFILGHALPMRLLRAEGVLGLLRATPVPMSQFIRAKLIASALPALVIETTLATVVVLRAHATASDAFAVLFGGAFITVVISAQALGLATLVVDLTDPDARPKLPGGYALLDVGVGMLTVASGVGVIASAIVTFPHIWLLGTAAYVGTAASIAAAAALLVAGARRLERVAV